MATSVSSPALSEQDGFRYPGWKIVLAAFAGVSAGFGALVVYTFSIFLKPLTGDFGWSRESVSRAFALAALSIAVASPFLGRLLDRYGPRRVILPCHAILGAAFLSLAWLTPNLVHLYAIYVVLGLVGNGTAQMGYSRAVSTWFDRKRGTALALIMAGSGVGAILLPSFGQYLISQAGWRNAYLVLGFLPLILGIPLTAWFVRERPGQARGATASGATMAEALRSRAFWLLAGTLFLSSICVNGAITHLAAVLTDRGVSAAGAAVTASVLGGGSVLGRLLTGALLDRYFGPRVSFGLLGLIALGVLLLSLASSVEAGLAAAALIGLGLGGEADVTPYLLTRYFGLRSFSALYGLTWTAYAIAGAIGPVVMGRVFDLTGSYAALFPWLAAATAASAALMLWMPRYEPAGHSGSQ